MIYELDPVDVIEVAAVGEPGKRRFFLLASGQGRTLTLACEKTQVQALIVRLHQMMEAQGVDTGGRAPSSAALAPGEPEWQVGQMFVLVASQAAAIEDATQESPQETVQEDQPSVRFWLSHRQVAEFSLQAEGVLTAGRPLCPRCGLPMDPAGHPCPVSNGARPIF